MKEKEPQIWGNGNVTIALGVKGYRIWVETLLIEHITKVEFRANEDKIELELKFESSQDSKIQIAIEESIRIAKTMPWIKIVY